MVSVFSIFFIYLNTDKYLKLSFEFKKKFHVCDELTIKIHVL